jgi:hypothetical protein
VRADHRRNRRGRRLRAAGSRRGGKTAKDGRIAFNFGSVFQKGQHIGTGQCPVKRYNEFLRDLIVAGKATRRSWSRTRSRENGWTKVLLHPTGNVSSHGAAR